MTRLTLLFLIAALVPSPVATEPTAAPTPVETQAAPFLPSENVPAGSSISFPVDI